MYGERFLIPEIDANVFDDLKLYIPRSTKYSEQIQLLEKWYKVDENRSPPMRILLPIEEVMPEFMIPEKKLNAWNAWK